MLRYTSRHLRVQEAERSPAVAAAAVHAAAAPFAAVPAAAVPVAAAPFVASLTAVASEIPAAFALPLVAASQLPAHQAPVTESQS